MITHNKDNVSNDIIMFLAISRHTQMQFIQYLPTLFKTATIKMSDVSILALPRDPSLSPNISLKLLRLNCLKAKM